MISDGCFDNAQAEVANGYEYGAGHTTYLAGRSSGINEWLPSLVRKLRRPIIAASR